jgi:hypothetical protein
MKAICYRNTLTNLPNWNPNDKVHLYQPLGFAYEDNNHYIHLYGWNSGFQGISIGLTVVEGVKNEKSLQEWVIENFGATDIKQTHAEIGYSIKGVWRPGLYYDSDVIQAIGTTEHERFLSEQAIRTLIQKLDEIFFFIEPHISTKNVFSHKIRELLILTCTEIENFWNSYLIESNLLPNKSGFSTTQYIKLKDKLYLGEFEFNLISYPELGTIRPFESWSYSSPTQSLFWYDAYNKTKHDRTGNFTKATLWNTVNAIVGCLILHCVKFGPYTMFGNQNHFSSMVKQHFSGRIFIDCKETFYVPKIEIPDGSRIDKFVFNPKKVGLTKDYIIKNLTI